MPNPLKTRYALSQPNFGVQIDWGHPLANGMTGCWLSNGGSRLPINLVSGRLATLDTSGRIPTMTTRFPDGICLNPAPSTLYDTGLASMAYNQGTVVMKMGYDQTWNPAGNVGLRPFFGMQDQTPTPNNLFGLEALGDGVNNWIYAGWSVGGVDYRIKVSPPLANFTSNPDLQIIVLTWDSNVGTFLYNRICPAYANIGGGTRDSSFQGQLLTLGSNLTPPIPAAINAGGFGFMGIKFSNAASTGGNPYYSPWPFTYLYNRVLSYDEINWITTEPYSMFQQPKHLWNRTADIVKAGIVIGV